ncbi:hypothetical protein F4776DRAFT_357952 [Hypoxylon sp. NC0597]|nr:hypothetical protein F4776DRAFT_357952 [Hypoxylon sp. NC0597]
MATNIDIEAQQIFNNPTNGQSVMGHSLHGATQTDAVTSGLKHDAYGALRRLGRIFDRKSKYSTEGRPAIIKRTLDDYRHGYPHLGAFLALDQNYLIFRRFGYLQARVLLNIQDQLREYEDKLVLLEKECEDYGVQSREADDQHSWKRIELLQKIENKLERYTTFMKNASWFSLREAPSETNFNIIDNYFGTYAPIVENEMYYLHKKDLVTVKPREDTPMDRLISKFLRDDPGPIRKRIFGNSEKARRYPGMVVISGWKSMVLRTVLLGLPLMILLVAPIIPLYSLSKGEITTVVLVGIMVIQLAFTCLFASCLKCLTRPKRHELFAGSVAYMGVLIVFMSQTIQGSH